MEDKLQTLHEEEPQTQVTVYRSLPYAPTRKFLPGKAKQIIGEVLREKLGGIEYDAEAAPGLCRDIADAIRVRLKEFEFERYKIIVQAVVGEMRNQGFQMACKCFWDPDTDDYAEDSFTTDRLFGIAVVFGMLVGAAFSFTSAFTMTLNKRNTDRDRENSRAYHRAMLYFNNFDGFKFVQSVNSVVCLYSIVHIFVIIIHLLKGESIISSPNLQFVSFMFDQMLTYFLLSCSSLGASQIEAIEHHTDHLFWHSTCRHSSLGWFYMFISIVTSFLTFFVLAFTSLTSAYIVFKNAPNFINF